MTEPKRDLPPRCRKPTGVYDVLCARPEGHGGGCVGPFYEHQTYADGLRAAAQMGEVRPTPDAVPEEEIGGDECGDALPGDEGLPLSLGSEDPELYAERDGKGACDVGPW